MDFYNWQIQIRKGLLDIIVLNFLQHRNCHGYELVQALKKLEGLEIREGNIYAVLTRLQIDGLVTNWTEASTDGPPRKYFKLTKQGQKTLSEMNDHWNQITQGITNIQRGKI